MNVSLHTNVKDDKKEEKDENGKNENEKEKKEVKRKTYAEIVKGGIRDCNAIECGTLVPSASESKDTVSFGLVNEIKRRKYRKNERLCVSH